MNKNYLTAYGPGGKYGASIRIFYSGALPRGSVLLSEDGKEWQTGTKFESCDAGKNIKCAKVEFRPQEARFVKLSFGKRKKPLIISEVEIWKNK